MIGCPTETREDIEVTINVSLRLKPEYVHVTIFTPYPASAVYRKALHEGVIGHDYWRELARNPEKGIITPYWYENFTRQELFGLLDHFYRCFYGRPSYILTNLLKIRSFNELKKKAKLGLKVLGLIR